MERVFPAPNTSAQYCLYVWDDAGASSPFDVAYVDQLRVAFPPAIIGELSEDCVVVGPLAGEKAVNAEVRPWLEDRLFQAAGGLSQLPDVRSNVGLGRVRIAVADTSPESKDSAIPHGKSHHGYSVGWIAQRLACPGGPDDPRCRASVTTHLALPRVTNDEIDLENGGYFGTPVELARAIFLAVEQWRQQASRGPEAQQRLVINLSVGWQPGHESCPARSGVAFPWSTSTGLADDDTVFAALIHAACHGALVIAAAGNDPGGASIDGPTCPAAWQDVLAPTQAQCDAFEGAGYALALPSAYPLLPTKSEKLRAEETPLIHGIGGVDYTGAPLSTTRRGSLGRHAAIAFHGVAGDPGKPRPAPLTGSSTSAAIVSGAAAALWAYRPELTGHAIMKLLHSTGSPVDGYASDLADLGMELDNPALPGPLHQVSLCHAFAALCPTLGCTPPQCSKPAASLFQNPVLPADLLASIDAFYGDATVYPAESTDQAPANQDHQTYLTAPWTQPSPIQPVCGGPCVFNVDLRRLTVSIDPGIPYIGSSSLTNMKLVLEDPIGQHHVFAPAEMAEGLGGQGSWLAGGLKPGAKIVLQPVPLPVGFQPSHAALVFQMNNNGEPASVVEPILVTGGEQAPLVGP